MRLPRWILPVIGYSRSWWWGIVRSERSQRARILYDEFEWSGKGMNPEELDEMIVEQRPRWRRQRRLR